MESFYDLLLNFWQIWLIEGTAVIILLAFIFVNWKSITKFTMSHMALSAMIIWLAGFIIYVIGFAHMGSGRALIAFILRAAQAALGMFISDNELREVSQFYKNNPIYMSAFAVVHVCAIVLSAIFILNTVGFRLKQRFFLFMERIESRTTDKDTYVFWSFSESSLSLAKDVRKKLPEARIIFIRSTADTSLGEKLQVSQLVNSSSLATRALGVMKTINSIDDAIVAYVSEDDVDELNLGSLDKILRRTTNIRLFFLRDDETMNIKLADMFYQHEELTKNPKKHVVIYTRASYGGKNRVLEDHIVLERQNGNLATWKFIDQSFISVNSLKYNYDYHPAAMVPRASLNNGAVDTDFSALILGFGNTGQQMFNYLYEFSAFQNSEGNQIKRNFVVVDKDLDTISGPLCVSNPALFESEEVKMLNCEIGTVEFWNKIKSMMPTINCISISLGDDEKDINMAIDFYRVVMQYATKQPENVKIFIRIFSQEYAESIKKLADDYNKTSKATGIEFVPYGSTADIFKYDVVVGLDHLKAAKIFNHNFDILRKKNLDLTAEQAWAKDYDIKPLIQRYRAVPLAIEILSRQIIQCHSDTMFIGSLLKLSNIEKDNYKELTYYANIVRSREAGTTVYKAASKEQQAMFDNLARQSHARLVASHWLLGYRYADADSIKAHPVHAARQKYTNLLTTWEECPEDIKLLAYTVVDTSFIIASEID